MTPSQFSATRKEYLQEVDEARQATQRVREKQQELEDAKEFQERRMVEVQILAEQLTAEFKRLNEYEQDFLGGTEYLDNLFGASKGSTHL